VRIGLFGGTFDPIHYGHLRAAEEAREAFGLQRVLFVPSAHPPHKDMGGVSRAGHRLEMVRRAVAGHPAFEVSDVECRRPGKSYAVETLRALRRLGGEEGADLYTLLGSDAFLEIETWHSCAELFELSHWVVMQRPGTACAGNKDIPAALRPAFRFHRGVRAYAHRSGHWLFFRRLTCLEISGTQVRRLVRAGRSVRYLVPEAVEDYIRAKGLYSARG
jgi:nicotinate-nucleotide adenylyltransferase